MKTTYANQVSMGLAVLNVFDRYEAVWSALPKVAADVATLKGLVNQIQEDAGIQGTATEGVAAGKNRKQVAMINLVLPIADELHALADERGDDVLAAKTAVVFSDLANLADAEVPRRCQEIIDLARADLAELAAGGIEAADVDAAQAAVTACQPSATRDAIVGRMGRTQAIEEGIKAMGALLRTRVDKRMAKFKAKQPAFFTDYSNARIIVDLGQRHEPKPMAAGEPAAVGAPQA